MSSMWETGCLETSALLQQAKSHIVPRSIENRVRSAKVEVMERAV